MHRGGSGIRVYVCMQCWIEKLIFGKVKSHYSVGRPPDKPTLKFFTSFKSLSSPTPASFLMRLGFWGCRGGGHAHCRTIEGGSGATGSAEATVGSGWVRLVAGVTIGLG